MSFNTEPFGKIHEIVSVKPELAAQEREMEALDVLDGADEW